MVVNYAPEAARPRAARPKACQAQRHQVGLGTWLVICANDAAVTSRLQPLIDWRQREGYTVKLATTAETGTTANQIKTYIQNAYNTWTPPLEYVVLRRGRRRHLWHPHLLRDPLRLRRRGRSPVQPARGRGCAERRPPGPALLQHLTELDVIVAKSVNYEATPYVATDPAWFTRACLVGDPSSSGYSMRPGPAVDQDPPAADRLRPDRHRLLRELRQPDGDGAEPRRLHLLLSRLLRNQRLGQLLHQCPDQHQQAPLRRHQHLRDRLLGRRHQLLRGLPAGRHGRLAPKAGIGSRRHRHHRDPHAVQQLLHHRDVPGAALREPVGDGRGPHPRQVRALRELLTPTSRTPRPTSPTGTP